MGKRKGTTKFGWCLDGNDKKCIVVNVSGRKCSCECHKEKKK